MAKKDTNPNIDFFGAYRLRVISVHLLNISLT